MEYFLLDLDRAIIGYELHTFNVVPQLFTTLYPPEPATGTRGSGRNKKDEAINDQRNGGGTGGGSRGSNKGGNDCRNPHSNKGDAKNTNREDPNKDKGIFICTQLRYFKSKYNEDGAPNHQR